MLANGGADRYAARSGVHSWPRRLAALPPSPVRDRLAPVVGVRALLPQAEVAVRSVPLLVLDGEDKTRVRVRVDQQRLAGPVPTPLPLQVVITPLRGYERDAQRCLELLTAALGVEGRAGAADAALSAAGRLPRPGGSPAPLDPAGAAVESLVVLLRGRLEEVEAAVPGVLDDLDIEFLHELRTALRATRSLLRLCGDVLPGSQAERFAAEFAWLGRLTSPVRDLDVHLLELAAHADPDGLLVPLRTRLAADRRRAYRALRAGLRSARGQELTAGWRRTLDQVQAADLPGRTTGELAATTARSAYRRVLAAAGPIGRDTPADDLHRLRRRCKRMRYLLDGYRSVYPEDALRTVGAALRQLQDCLGTVQDRTVQRRRVAEIAHRLGRRDADVECLLALGALRERLARQDRAARRRLERRLAALGAPAMRAAVAALATPAASRALLPLPDPLTRPAPR